MVAWAGIAAAFGLFVGTGNWIGVGALVAAVLFLALLLTGVWGVTVVWMLGFPTVFVFANDLASGLPFVRVERVLFLAILGMMAWQRIMSGPSNVRMIPLERRIVYFLVLCVISMLIGGRGKALSALAHDDFSFLFDGYFMAMTAFFIARRVPWTDDRLSFFVRMLTLVGIFLGLVAILQIFLGVTAFTPKYLVVIHTGDRATGTFGNAPEFGMVAASLLLLAAYQSGRERDALLRAGYVVAILLMAAAVVLSKTRGVWVGLVASMAVLYVLDRRSRPLLGALTVVGGLAITAVLPYLLTQQGLLARIYDVDPIYNRLAGWATAVNIMVHNPLLGIGLSRYGFGQQKNEYLVGLGQVSGQWAETLNVPHNEFLLVGAMTGVIGFVLYLAVYGAIARAVRSVWRDPRVPEDVQRLAKYIGVIVVGCVANAIIVDFVNFRYIYVLMFFLLGMLVAQYERTAGAGAADAGGETAPPPGHARGGAFPRRRRSVARATTVAKAPSP
ncbi:MAG: hypothetical protein GC151_18885 [Betaproteobacteria bacterium]|nr:hypothetical protein [Betaproteobacteria bacterium]